MRIPFTNINISVTRSFFDGGGWGKRFKKRMPKQTSGNGPSELNVMTLRERVRDLERNNSWAGRSIDLVVNNVINWGIGFNVYTIEGGEKHKLHDLFDRWANDRNLCDYTGQCNFSAMQRMALASVVRDGEVFVAKRKFRGDRKSAPLQMEIYEADFVDIGYNETMDNGHEIKNGIEFDAKGKRVAYWFYEKHPAEGVSDKKRIPASDVLHLFRVDRPGQIRGYSWLSRIVVKLRDLDDYEDATLLAHKIQAAHAGFLKRPSTGGLLGQKSEGEIPDIIEAGTIVEMPDGYEITFNSPPKAEGINDVMKNNLRAVAGGVGHTYEALTGDYSNVNFSSARMGWLEAVRTYENVQYNFMIPNFCEEIFKWFVSACFIDGQINSVEGFKVSWTPPRREMINPSAEIKAKIQAMEAGLLSPDEALRAEGYDPNDVVKSYAAYKLLLEENGLGDLFPGKNFAE
jgi:lambda family phage portal protein